MSSTDSTAHLAGLNAAQQIERIALVGRIAARLAAPGTYGYTDAEALATARTMVATYTADEVAVFLGEREGCTNCRRPAVRNGRCVKCQHLASDDI